MLGERHPDLVGMLNALALLYKVQGRYAQAEPLYQRAVAIQEAALGPGHPDLAVALKNLAELYEYQTRHAEAHRLQERARAIQERSQTASGQSSTKADSPSTETDNHP